MTGLPSNWICVRYCWCYYPRHYLAGQGHQYCCAGACWLSQHTPLFCQRRLWWRGHLHRMGDGNISKDVLYRELAKGHHPTGCPALHFKDVCKRDLKLADIDPGSWEQIADDCSAWRSAVRKGVRTGEDKRNRLLEDKRQCRKKRQESLDPNQRSAFCCTTCDRNNHSRIGLVSHARRCSKQNWWPDRAFHYLTR